MSLSQLVCLICLTCYMSIYTTTLGLGKSSDPFGYDFTRPALPNGLLLPSLIESNYFGFGWYGRNLPIHTPYQGQLNVSQSLHQYHHSSKIITHEARLFTILRLCEKPDYTPWHNPHAWQPSRNPPQKLESLSFSTSTMPDLLQGVQPIENQLAQSCR